MENERILNDALCLTLRSLFTPLTQLSCAVYRPCVYKLVQESLSVHLVLYNNQGLNFYIPLRFCIFSLFFEGTFWNKTLQAREEMLLNRSPFCDDNHQACSTPQSSWSSHVWDTRLIWLAICTITSFDGTTAREFRDCSWTRRTNVLDVVLRLPLQPNWDHGGFKSIHLNILGSNLLSIYCRCIRSFSIPDYAMPMSLPIPLSS